jgi:outer membrane receptor protein involved in Fe transport
MPFRLTAIAFLFLQGSVSLLFAQDAAEPDSRTEPTLPEVEVTPPVVPTLPEVQVSPQEQSATTTPFDSSTSYPDLTDRVFGQTSDAFGQSTGILRSRQSLFDSPVAGSITTRQQILEKQSPDMFHALQNEVGVLMQRTAIGQSSPFVRGLTGQQVLILVDGIRLNNSFFRRGPNQYFNTIDPGMVDHIEVLRGQGSVLWGSDAIGGVINVVTRGPDSHYGRHHGDYFGSEFQQTFNTADSGTYSRLNVEGWTGNAGFFGGGSYLNAQDLDTGFDFGRQPGTNYSQYSGDIKFRYLLAENQMLTFALQHHEQNDVPRSDRFPGFPGDLNNSNTAGRARFFDPQQRDLAYIRYEALTPIDGIDAVTATASYHRQREIQTRGMPVSRSQETDVESTGLNLVAVRDLDELGKLSAGVDWYHDDVDSSFGGTASGPIVPDDAYYERLGTFLNWDVTLTDHLTATAGVRYENLETAGTPIIASTAVPVSANYHDWVSQVGLVFEVAPSVHLVGSISEGFRAPNLDDLMANNPNVLQQGMSVPSLGLTPERSINYEVGVKTNSERLRTQTFVYWLDIEDNIVSISAAPNTFASANQDSFVQGVEFDGEYLLDDGWSLYGNFWYTHGRNEVTGSPLSRIPPTQGILGLRWRAMDAKSWFAIYTWMVRRQDRLDQVRDVADERIPAGGTPGYATLNLRAGHAFGCHDQHRVSLGLENVTDKSYLVHGSGVFGTGFTARMGYSWVY